MLAWMCGSQLWDDGTERWDVVRVGDEEKGAARRKDPVWVSSWTRTACVTRKMATSSLVRHKMTTSVRKARYTVIAM
jgi:hypothetical protein